MKKYHNYIISWWVGTKRYEKMFNMRKWAVKFAAQLVEDDNTQERYFYDYDYNMDLVEVFTF